MNRKITRGLFKTVIGLIVTGVAVAAFLFWLADPFNLTAISDQKLIATFHQHREAFEKLHHMADEDGRQVSYISESDVRGAINDTRKQEYKNLLSELCPSLKVVTNYDSVRFIFANGGLSAISGGWLKGIEYVSGDYRKEGELVQNLDKANTLPPNVYLREIEPNWFVVYQRIDD